MKKGEGKGKVGQNRSINTINGSHRNPFLTRRIGEEGENTIGVAVKLVHLPMMDHFLINFHHNRLSCSSPSYYSKKEQNGSSFQLQSDLSEIFIAFHKFTGRNDFFFLFFFFFLENRNFLDFNKKKNASIY